VHGKTLFFDLLDIILAILVFAASANTVTIVPERVVYIPLFDVCADWRSFLKKNPKFPIDFLRFVVAKLALQAHPSKGPLRFRFKTSHVVGVRTTLVPPSYHPRGVCGSMHSLFVCVLLSVWMGSA